MFLNEQKFGPGDGFLNCELLAGLATASLSPLFIVFVRSFSLLSSRLLTSDVFSTFGADGGMLTLCPLCNADYLYNWSCAPIDGGAKGTTNRESSGIGMVML